MFLNLVSGSATAVAPELNTTNSRESLILGKIHDCTAYNLASELPLTS